MSWAWSASLARTARPRPPTSCARCWRRPGCEPGWSGTIETVAGGEVIARGRQTTPEAPELQADLAAMVEAGDRWAVVESTSHGLAQRTRRRGRVRRGRADQRHSRAPRVPQDPRRVSGGEAQPVRAARGRRRPTRTRAMASGRWSTSTIRWGPTSARPPSKAGAQGDRLRRGRKGGRPTDRGRRRPPRPANRRWDRPRATWS